MASSAPVGTAHNWTEQAWATKVEHEVERQTVGMSFLGKGDRSTIMLDDKLAKGYGETVTFKFSPTTETDGVSESEDIYAKAANVDLFDDSLTIDYLGFSWLLNSPMDFQRQSSNLKRIVFWKAVAQWQRRYEETIMAHLGGHTPNNTKTIAADAVSNLKFAGHNTIVLTDENHKVYAQGSGSANTTDALVAADTAAGFKLDYITKLETRAMSKTYVDYPIAPGQDGFYDIILHPMQWEQARVNSTAGQWQDIQLAAMKGGAKQKNTGLANGWMGLFSKTRIHVSDYVPQGVTSGSTQANTRVAPFLGRCAGVMAFGKGYNEGSHLDWSQEKIQLKKWLLLVDSIFGFKTVKFPNSSGTDENYGCMNLVTYTPD